MDIDICVVIILDIQELLTTRSPIALVNGEPWDLHRPLTKDCEISFQHFQNDDPQLANKVSFLW